MTDLIDDYDELNVDEVRRTLSEGEFTADDLEDIREYEQRHKDRVTVNRAITDALDDAPPGTVEVAAVDRGSVAGHWFDYVHEVREVQYTPRVERAIERGQLERIGAHE